MPKNVKKGLLLGTAFTTIFVLSGCVFGGEQASKELKEENPPLEVEMVEDEASLSEESEMETMESKEEQVELVSRELYLFDSDGFVVPQTVNLPVTKGVVKQSLHYLVKNGPVTEMLPNGFQAVLPQGTEILGVNLTEDGTVIADFSQEFANYKPEEEMKILQAITWTLTQFENVNNIKIRINGTDQPFMPVDGTPIGDGISRANGINLDNGEIVDITNSNSVTLYFLNQNGDQTYYVPVTKRIKKEMRDPISLVINELIKGPSMESDLLTEFHPNTVLIDEPKYENGVVTLNFNEAILGHLDGTAISSNIVNPLVLSLTEQEGIESVAIQVNGKSNVLNEEGQEMTKPVVRPTNVNTGSF